MRRKWLIVAGVMALVAWTAAGTDAQQAATAPLPDIQTLGPQVGARVPDFSLPDQTGATRTLRSLMGPKGLMLVFYRSADWCPYCKTQLAELETRLPDLKRQGINVAAVSYDSVGILADFTRRRGITFPLLSDAGSRTIRTYGIFNTTVPESNTQSYGIPFPGTFLLDTRGVVTSRFFEQAYQERVTVGSMLARLGQDVSVQAAVIKSPQVEVTSYLTDSVAAAGTHFSVVLDVQPAAGMHVYAPGVQGYKPVALTLQAAPGVILRDAQYPQSETYVFAPLNERVQVYMKPFRIVQDVTIDASAAGRAALKDQTAVTLKGSLAYQACDDKVCYTPQSVPLSWTIALRDLDRERAQK